ncbi:MAG: orotate phosphoribosyltransferase, partial [Thomasclavelia spiroformis]
IENGLAKLIKDNFPDANCLMGTATAGIAHAALVADILDLPMGYVRGGAKSHGRNNRIEGKVEPGMKVVVVEDLISTGGSSLECVEALREAGCEVIGLIAIFTYGLPKATTNFEAANCKYATLTDYDTLIEVAKQNNYIKDVDMEKLKAWKKDPNDESWMAK